LAEAEDDLSGQAPLRLLSPDRQAAHAAPKGIGQIVACELVGRDLLPCALFLACIVQAVLVRAGRKGTGRKVRVRDPTLRPVSAGALTGPAQIVLTQDLINGVAESLRWVALGRRVLRRILAMVPKSLR